MTIQKEIPECPKPFCTEWAKKWGGYSGGYIHKLRMMGRSRYRKYQSLSQQGVRFAIEIDIHKLVASPSMKALELGEYHHHEFQAENQREIGPDIYVDLGSGDSPDADIACEMGYYAFGVDVVPRSVFDEYGGSTAIYWHRDITEELPFGKNTVGYVSMNAVIDLIDPLKRPALYQNIFDICAAGATFALTFVKLSRGHGIDKDHEVSLIEKAGFKQYRNFDQNGVLFMKDIDE